jgi:hypothetical protein
MAKEHAAPGYEFSEEQNKVIQSLSQKMKVLGIFYMVVAGLAGLVGFATLVHGFRTALMMFGETAFFAFMGLWTHRGAGSFQMIVDTQENDISHLMKAIDELRKIYNLQVWLLAVMLALVVLTIVAGMVYGAVKT